MKKTRNELALLGLDIGPNSIGWAIVTTNGEGKPQTLNAAGVRVFKEGLDDLKRDGRGKSRNVARRDARGRRRLIERKSRRLDNLATLLQKSRLLPDGPNLKDAQQRHMFFEELDSKLESPYALRTKALDVKLEPVEIGRAIYHLSQKRGFLSNRKSAPKDEDAKKGVVKTGISDLEKAVASINARTLGEYYSKLHQDKQRIRGHYTHRTMYENEFNLIWSKQAAFYPEILNDQLRKKIYNYIFYQRPLKSQSKLIGACEVELGRKRAPWALLSAQRFRYLQTINNLLVFEKGDFNGRPLSANERQVIISELEKSKELSFKKIKELLGIRRDTKFNLENGGEKRIMGNTSAAKLIAVFGEERWNNFSEEKREAIIEDWRSVVKDKTLKNRGMKVWGLTDEEATRFSQLELEEGYCNFSRQALQKLLPKLNEGIPTQSAIKECYPQKFERMTQAMDILPPLADSGLPDLRNPIVSRALNELRGTVNSIIKRYGKPEIIRIELARELRQTAKQREEATKRMRANEKTRKTAFERIVNEAGIAEPSYTDILKIQLADECDWICPYTGKSISMQNLVGKHPQFDIEHIIPFERSLDDSYVNKTLCDAHENRAVKHKRSPYEAYFGTPKWDEIIDRINKNFKGRMADEKIRRFCLDNAEVEKMFEEFTSRQLNDTRWATRWAKQYLGLLYGGNIETGVNADGKLSVQAVSGSLIAQLRKVWGLNNILGNDDIKSRDDHRHHAVDAITIAMATQSMVKELSEAARRPYASDKRLFSDVPQPWQGFHEEIETAINNVVVSPRLERRVRGALHKESFYSKPRKDNNGKQYVCIRKPLEALTANEVEEILHPTIRNLVKSKLQSSGKPPKDTFKDASSRIFKITNGREITVNRVRIRVDLTEIFEIPHGFVQSDTNHHMAIYKDDNTGNWDAEVVSMNDAYKRLKEKKSVINRHFGEGKTFIFSLAGGDIIELHDIAGQNRSLFIIRTVPQSKQLYFTPINDARPAKDIGKKGLTALPNTLKSRNCRKVIVTPLGEVRYAND